MRKVSDTLALFQKVLVVSISARGSPIFRRLCNESSAPGWTGDNLQTLVELDK